jgi:hypothetical protein
MLGSCTKVLYKVFLNFLDCPIVHKLCASVQLWEIIHVLCMKSLFSRIQCCTLCYSIMSHATLILFLSCIYVNSMDFHNNTCTLVVTGVIVRSLECIFSSHIMFQLPTNHSVTWGTLTHSLIIKLILISYYGISLLRVGLDYSEEVH